MNKEVYNYKRAAIKATRELGYSEEIIKKLRVTDREEDIIRIMRSARK